MNTFIKILFSLPFVGIWLGLLLAIIAGMKHAVKNGWGLFDTAVAIIVMSGLILALIPVIGAIIAIWEEKAESEETPETEKK
jgi:hypothetical protein